MCTCEDVPECTYVYPMYGSPESSEEVALPGTGGTKDYESPCGYWEMNPGSLEDQ